MNMKRTFQLIFATAIVMMAAALHTSCEDDSDTGTPFISYVRITDPTASDSLLISANQGSLVAIMGENLQDAQEIWFNNLESSLSTVYITSSSILVKIPSKVPTSVTNKLKIIFAGGDSLLYDFKITINKPTIKSMSCEYVQDGGVAIINGDYFYPPLSVVFEGGLVAKLDSVGEQVLKVVVPEGAQPGRITIKTNFGETKSDFWFRDNRNILVGEDMSSCWAGPEYVVTNPGAGDPPIINNSYLRIKKELNSWQWTALVADPKSTIPDEAILKPELYNLKFELCTMMPYNANGVWINIGNYPFNADLHYNWNPTYNTKGEWQTVTIPFEDVMAVYDSPHVVSPDGTYTTRIVYCGNGSLVCDMSYDNFRVVRKTLPLN